MKYYVLRDLDAERYDENSVIIKTENTTVEEFNRIFADVRMIPEWSVDNIVSMLPEDCEAIKIEQTLWY